MLAVYLSQPGQRIWLQQRVSAALHMVGLGAIPIGGLIGSAVG